MTVAEIQVDQRVIGVDSRHFASVEKALVELITNSDDNYARLAKTGAAVTGRILVSSDFEQAARILTYGCARSPLSRCAN